MDEDHATITLPPPLQLGITVTASLCLLSLLMTLSNEMSSGYA